MIPVGDISIFAQYGTVIVAHELSPSTLISLKKEEVVGFATDFGGRTSHISILARSMQIPAVSGLRNVSVLIQPGDTILINGTGGMVIIIPMMKTFVVMKKNLLCFSNKSKNFSPCANWNP
jgi:phosphoenolpyruvate-protein kinase (PTS system EI component)